MHLSILTFALCISLCVEAKTREYIYIAHLLFKATLITSKAKYIHRFNKKKTKTTQCWFSNTFFFLFPHSHYLHTMLIAFLDLHTSIHSSKHTQPPGHVRNKWMSFRLTVSNGSQWQLDWHLHHRWVSHPGGSDTNFRQNLQFLPQVHLQVNNVYYYTLHTFLHFFSNCCEEKRVIQTMSGLKNGTVMSLLEARRLEPSS